MKKAISNALFLLLFSVVSLSGFSQTGGKKVVSGTVLDKSSVPLPGVNVIEKGTNNGAVTDFDGNYSISVSEGSTIVFTFIGMKTTEKVVGDQTTINVTLQEDTESLNEVVVVGYGNQKREAVTGSVATVDVEEIEDLPVGNLASALVGRVLGVSVSGGESRPGAPARITIRQPFTLAKDGGTTDPLYVIDGVLQVDAQGRNDSTLFNNLDASEVESISFLKDASAAIYGSRAAQGVVLVTTKRGKKGPARFSYSGNFSVADETYRTKMLNASQYAKVFNIMNGPNGFGRVYDPENYTSAMRSYFFSANEIEHFETLNYDALDDNWTSAGTQRHNLNLSGGNEDATYFGGISYYTQEGNLGTLNYDRWSFRAGSNVNLAKGFKADFQVSGFFTDVSNTFSKIGTENVENDFRQLQNRAPFLPMYINDLPVQVLASGGDDLQGYHYEEIQRLQNLARTVDNNVSVNINVEYEVPFIEGLKVKANYARQESNNRGNQKGNRYNLYEFFGPEAPANLENYHIYYEDGSGPFGENTIRTSVVDGEIVPYVNEVENGDRIYIANERNVREQSRFQTTYNRSFGLHNVSALFAVEKSETEYNKEQVIKFGSPDWGRGMLWEATGVLDESNTFNWRSESGDLGYIGRLNYDYDGKYYAEFLYRSDASAKFAPKNYWGDFYSISAGWIISKESFFKSNTIDYLKFRGSVGLLGKDDIRPWSYVQRFNFQGDGGVVFGGNKPISPGLQPSGPANPDVKWSDELKTNFGFEARFLDHRLSTTIETYYNIGTNMLINLNAGVPFTVGGATTATNWAAIDTWGTEISLGWNDDIGEDFSYGVNFNIGWGNNKVIKGDFADISTLRPWQAKPGENADTGTWGYDYIGMFKTQEEIDNYIAETGITEILGKTASQLRPGMLYYRDLRGAWNPETQTFEEKDGKVDENDQVQLAKPARGPQGFASTIRLRYKQLSLNTVLNVNWGGYREVSGTARKPMSSNSISGNYENRPAFWADMYDPELNPTGTIPNLYTQNREINSVSSRFWEVSSFSLVMRNINLSYTLPKKLVNKAGLRNFRLNLVAMNPFILFNPYKDYGLTPYGSYDNYPVLRTYSLGINVGF